MQERDGRTQRSHNAKFGMLGIGCQRRIEDLKSHTTHTLGGGYQCFSEAGTLKTSFGKSQMGVVVVAR
jgi:hypothetical protein